VVDQRLHALDEAHRMRQAGVMLERRFVSPARMDVEQSRVANRSKAWMLRQPGSSLEGATVSRSASATAPSLPGRA
jgi:hypothetical protein